MLIHVIPLQNTKMCVRTYQSRRLILVTDHRVMSLDNQEFNCYKLRKITYQFVIHFVKQCLSQVVFCDRQLILQLTYYLKTSKREELEMYSFRQKEKQ